MIKQIALLKTKAGMSRDAFIKRYEEGHAPLAIKLVPYFQEYRRSFFIPGSMVSLAHVGEAATRPEFDVVTEMWYQDQAVLDRLARELAETDIGQRIAEDETHLFDRSRMVMFAVDEFVTPPETLAPRPSGMKRPAIKQICLMKKKPGMSREAFIEYYEKRHAVLALKLLVRNGKPIFAEYSRSFPTPDGAFKMGHVEAAPPEIGFDVMTEIWFWTEDDHKFFMNLCGDSEIGAALATDEANLFDRGSIKMFFADEYISAKDDIEAAAKAAA